jgi:protein O-mannosyl-transferase
MGAFLRRNLPQIGLILLVAFCFAPLLFADFTSWDDYLTVARNWRMRPPTISTIDYYFTHGAMDIYIPATYTVWTTVAAIANRHDAASSLNPAFFHAINIVIHALSVLTVYNLIRQLTSAKPIAAFLGAAVFAIHPVQVEAVAWVSGLKDVLCGFFCLTALSLYCRTAPEPPPIGIVASMPRKVDRFGDLRRAGWYALATLFYVLAMLAKPTAMILPLMAIAIDLFFLRRRDFGSPRQFLWVILATPCAVWTHNLQPAISVEWFHPMQRALVAADAISFYLGKLIFPLHLCVDYGHTPSVALAGTAHYTWIIPLILFVAVVSIPVCRRLLGPAILFVIPLLPVLGLVPFDFQTYSTVADHYLYLSMLAIAFAVASISARRSVHIVFAFSLVAFLPLTFLQTHYWLSSTTLFEHTLSVNPRSFAAYNSLAAADIERNDFPAAEVHARAALAIAPQNVTAHVHLAAALAQTGSKQEAMKLLHEALAIDPTSSAANINLGGLLADLHDPGAEAQLRRAITLSPDDPSPYQNLGTLLASQNRLDEALKNLAIARQLAPGDVRVATNYAIVRAAQGNRAEAVEELRRALQIDPNFAPARQALLDLGENLSDQPHPL